MTIKLSICIPTYNRAELLGHLLESLASEAIPADVEIAISDNASTDATEAVVRTFQSRWPTLIYHRQPKNLGPDRNYLKCVEIATGSYCWLMGSDDCIAPGAVQHVLRLITDEPHDVYLGTRINCTFDMTQIGVEPWLENEQARFFDFSSDTDFLEYHRRALALGAVFSYLSSIVVKRDRWNAFPVKEHYIGSAYSHAWLLLQVANASGIYYSPQPLVLNRRGNDHFATDGEAKRILIDLDGYVLLANDLFPNSGVRRDAFLALLRRAHKPLRTLVALRSRLDGAEWRAVCEQLHRCGYTPQLISAVSPFPRILRALLGAKNAVRAVARQLG